MGANKVALAAAGVSMLLWVATPVLAGHGHGGGNAFGFGDTAKHVGGHIPGLLVSRTATSMGRIAGSIARTMSLANMGSRGEPTPPHTSRTMIPATTLNSERRGGGLTMLRPLSKSDSGVTVATTLILGAAFLLAGCFVLTGCSGQPLSTREKGTLGGGVLGAGAGAIVGAAVGHPAAGAAIGGALGAGTGYVVGNSLQNQEVTSQQQGQIQHQQRAIQSQRHQIQQLQSEQSTE